MTKKAKIKIKNVSEEGEIELYVEEDSYYKNVHPSSKLKKNLITYQVFNQHDLNSQYGNNLQFLSPIVQYVW